MADENIKSDPAGTSSRLNYKVTDTETIDKYINARSIFEEKINSFLARQIEALNKFHEQNQSEIQALYEESDTTLFRFWQTIVSPFVMQLDPDLRKAWKTGSVSVDISYYKEHKDAYVIVYPEWIISESNDDMAPAGLVH